MRESRATEPERTGGKSRPATEAHSRKDAPEGGDGRALVGLGTGGPPPTVSRAPSLLALQRLAGNSAVSAMLAEDQGASARRAVDSAVGGSGAPLPGSVRQSMEPALGQDLSGVRVHQDSRSTEALDSHAYTSGNNIVVNPSSGRSDAVLAHEAVHVAQQRSGPVTGTDMGGGLSVSEPGDAFEQEAHQVSSGAMSGSGGAVQRLASGDAGSPERGPMTLQRFPATAATAPGVRWPQLTASVDRPGEGVSGGIYILTSNQKDAPVPRVVVKPIFGESGLGTAESTAQMTFGDRAVAAMFGIGTPVSRGVQAGSQEFTDLMTLCRTKEPPKPTDPESAALWKPLSEAQSFIVMSEVPGGSSIKSMATKAANDPRALDRLEKAIFNPDLVEQIGRLCVADLLIGNNDRLVSGAANLGNVMVSAGEKGPKLWAVDSNAVLGKMKPDEVITYGSSSLTGTKGVSREFDTPTKFLENFYDAVVSTMRRATAPTTGGTGSSEGLVLDLADVVQLEYDTRKNEIDGYFMKGWQSGLDLVRQSVETKQGRKKLRGLTDSVQDETGTDNVRYTTLKTHAMYLGARGRGVKHEQAGRDAGAYSAAKMLAEFDPATVDVPQDEYYWTTAHLPTSAFSAQLEQINALPAPNEIVNIVPQGTGGRYTYDKAKFATIGKAASDAKDEVAQLGTKTRGVFSRGEQTRNRVTAGRFVAETYQLGAGAIRAAASMKPLKFVMENLEFAAGGNLTPSQASGALPAAAYLVRGVPSLQRDLYEYGVRLRETSSGVAQLKRYLGRADLAKTLSDLGGYLDRGAKQYLDDPKMKNPAVFVNALKGAAQAKT